VDYLGAQGYWVCVLVAVLSFIGSAVEDHPIAGAFLLLVYYFGGVGVRERSRYAATVVFLLYVLDFLLSGFGVIKIFITALLLSNLRATWIASSWMPGAEEASLPPRLNETLGDKFADKLPEWLWPKVRIPYYVLSAGFLAVVAAGIVIMASRHPH
jgi:hypothetical protein